MSALAEEKCKQVPWFSPRRTLDGWPTHGLELVICFIAVNAFIACGFYVFDFLILHAFFPGIAVWDTEIAILFGGFITTLVVYGMLNRLRTSLQRLKSEVDERESIEAALRQERDKFMNILESMADGVYIANAQYDIEYINPVIHREFGAVENRKCYEYFHGRAEPCPWCKSQEVFSGNHVRWTWYLPRNRKTYDLLDTPIKNPDGTISKLEILHDITELMETREALCQSEERYRILFHEANDALFLLGLNPEGGVTRYQEVNAVACEMLGYTREELLQVSPFDIAAPEFHGRMLIDLEKLIHEKKLIFERIFLTKDGTRIPVEVSTRLFEHQGKPTLLSIARDLSRRKEAEEALRQNEANYRKLSQEFQALLNAITDSLILLSPDLKVLWANNYQSCCSTRKACSVGERHCYELCKNRSAPCDDCPALRSFQSGRVETQVSTNEGRYLSVRAFPILNEGTVHNVIMVISDITEKMSLQAEILQARHLAALGELAAGLAHEINNPINGIINYAQILINKSLVGSREQDIAGRIIKESDRIANIVSSLFAFARPNKDERRPISVLAILSEALNLTQTQMRGEGIRLKVDVPDDLPNIVGNFQQLQQVFLNILNNARYALNEKYPGMHGDKRLEISGKVSVTDGITLVTITFHDRGAGISDEMVSKVTKPFFSTKPVGRGMGLGLTISERIITDHGGKLVIRSVEGEFTRVTVELPVEIYSAPI
jgi:PAS domain S-box-containing protein